MVGFRVKDQGESAGVRCKHLMQRNVLEHGLCCVCINTASSSLKELCLGQNRAVRLRNVCGGERKKSEFWKSIGGQT